MGCGGGRPSFSGKGSRKGPVSRAANHSLVTMLLIDKCK